MDPMDASREPGKTHVTVEWVHESRTVSGPGADRGIVRYGNQYLAALAANIGAFAFGAALSWSATALPSMRADPDFQKLTLGQEAFVGSIVALGALIAAPIIGAGVFKFGRRQTMVMLTLPFVAGWLLIYFASNVRFVFIGRLITGFCGGALSLAAPIYITDMASRNVAGVMTAGFDVMMCAGQLFIFIVGTYVDWRYQALACGIIPLVFHVFMWFVPESPRYLIRNNKREEALDALRWFRGVSEPRSVEDELNQLNQNMEDNTQLGLRSRDTSTWTDIFETSSLKPLLIIFFLFIFQELSAIDAVLFYTVDIFKATGIQLHSNYCAIIVGAVQLIAAVLATTIMNKVGRRVLLLISETFMCVALTAMGTFFYYKTYYPDTTRDYLQWLPLTSMCVFVVSYSIGMGPITYTILGELLPERVRGTGASFLTMIKWTVSFFVALFFEQVMQDMGRAGGFWLYACFCLLGAIFIASFIPETKSQAPEDIPREFVARTGKLENEPFSSNLTRTYGAR